MELEIDPANERLFGPCDCCGQMTRRLWGYVYEDESALAAYFVEWTLGHSHHEANFEGSRV